MNRHLVSATLTALLATFAGTAGAQNWVDITPASGPAPTARAYCSAVFDSQNRRMVVFGGRNATYLYEIWAFDLATETWIDINPTAGSVPSARRTPGSVYDPVGHRMVTWSGQGPGGFVNDAWEFDLTSKLWHQFSPVGGPPNIRYGVASAFDPSAGDLVTFAGFTNLGRFDDVWRFNATDTSWTDVSPGSGPGERCLHSASYDSQKDRLIMYGGQNNSGPLDDIWAFDYATNTWAELTPDTVPDGRFFVAHVYDSTNNRVTIFGGNTSPTFVNDVFMFDLWTEKWAEVSPSGTPPSVREGAAGVYDGAADRMVVFGGKNASSTYFDEVWALENLSNTVTSVRSPQASGIELRQNIPNPFNPSTSIIFQVRSPGEVALRIYDIQGRHVRTLVSGNFDSGEHTATWNGRDAMGRQVASGVYFYRLESGAERVSKRMVLLK